MVRIGDFGLAGLVPQRPDLVAWLRSLCAGRGMLVPADFEQVRTSSSANLTSSLRRCGLLNTKALISTDGLPVSRAFSLSWTN